MREYYGPQDTPSKREAEPFLREIQPYVTKAQQSYPSARERFNSGALSNYSFFVTVLLNSPKGEEMAFFKVEKIEDEKITGILSTRLQLLDSFAYGQRYTLPESDVIDWTITSPSGLEEGNFVGKFLDSQRKN